jgi:aminoglycoside phosphotransferase (APT) family kinase protein
MNIQDMEFIAEGRVSHVYLLKDKRVLKLLHDTVPHEKVDDEFRRCQTVLKAGVRSPRAMELVDVDNRRGIIFEWAGKTDLMNAKLQNPLNVASGARFMAKVQLAYLGYEAEQLPDIKAEALRMSRLLPEGTIRTDQYPKLEQYLARLPDGNTICHMDFHPGNILLDSGGYEPYQVIDWAEAVKGPAEADIAMTSLILSMAEESPGTNLLLRLLIPIFRKMFERYYRDAVLTSSSSITEEGIGNWMLVIAIFRMYMWNLESEYLYLKDLIQKKL